jgi:predicted nucleic acid-binding protein
MPIERIYIETPCFIDLIKYDLRNAGAISKALKNEIWFLQNLLKASESKEIQIITSTLTIAECRRANQQQSPDDEVKRRINSVLTSGRVITLSQVSQRIAERARDLEWDNGINLKGADSIHVATALVTDCKEFITFDAQGSRSPLKNAEKIRKLNVNVIVPSQTEFLPPEYRQNNLYV